MQLGSSIEFLTSRFNNCHQRTHEDFCYSWFSSHGYTKCIYTLILAISFIMNTSKAFDVIKVTLLFRILGKYLSFHWKNLLALTIQKFQVWRFKTNKKNPHDLKQKPYFFSQFNFNAWFMISEQLWLLHDFTMKFYLISCENIVLQLTGW